MTTLAVQTSRFGTIEVSQEDLVNFAAGLVGFSEYRQFALVRHSDTSPYRWLQSLDEGTFAVLVVDPAEVVMDYGPAMPKDLVQLLEIQEDTPRLVYCVITIPSGRPREMTINLAGPIVINVATRQGVQIVLEDEAYPVRHRVFSDAEEAVA